MQAPVISPTQATGSTCASSICESQQTPLEELAEIASRDPRARVQATGSTCASSVCDSQQTSLEPSSSRVLLEKASEMVRVEISMCDKRMTQLLETELESQRISLESDCFILRKDIEALVTIVESLTVKVQSQEPSAAQVAMNARFDVLIEEERRNRIDATAGLLEQVEGLAAQVQQVINDEKRQIHSSSELLDKMEALSASAEWVDKLDALSSINVNTLVDTERLAREACCARLEKDIQRLSDDIQAFPTAQLDDTTCWNKFNVLLDYERASRDAQYETLREAMEGLSAGMPKTLVQETPPRETSVRLDEEYLEALMEQERRTREVMCATLRKDFCKEMEALSRELAANHALPEPGTCKKDESEFEGST